MPRPERPVDPEGGPVARFAIGLREVRRCAGSPGYRELARRAHYSSTTLAQAAGGESLPSLPVALAYVRACGGDTAEWERRWSATAAELEPHPPHGPEDDTASDGCAPYVGLAAYGPDDAEWFHGRKRIIDELVTRVSAQRFVTVIGPSGTGKSSILRAGLLPRLTVSGSTLVAIFTPGERPLEECAIQLAQFLNHTAGAAVAELTGDARGLHRLVRQALANEPAGSEIVLVIDQFEEVFTLCHDTEERARFISTLVSAARTPDSRCRIVLGVRADFYPHCLLDAELADAMNDGQIAVGAMTVDELREVIVRPARLAGCMVEGALLATLVTHTHGRVGALPLLSHALLETWSRRSGNTLTLAGFERAGGIDGALTKTAEAAFASLDETQQSTTRQLFLRLVVLGEGTQDTKRRVGKEELDEDTAAILDAFRTARLVVLSEHGVEITHEALIGAWPRLRSWLVDDREGQRIHRQLTEATATWENHHRDSGALLRGARLAVVTAWARRHCDALNTAEAVFLAASMIADERERATVRRQARVRRGAVALLVVLLVITTTAAIQAMHAQQAATQQANVAIALNAIRDAENLADTSPALAAQISLAAYRMYPSKATENSLIAHAAAATAQPVPTVEGTVSLAPDGRLAADARSDTDATALVDIGSLKMVATVLGGRFPVRFSPDGRTLLTVDRNAVPRLWDVSTPARPTMLSTLPTRAIRGIFSPDSNVLVTTDAMPRLDPARATSGAWTEATTSRVWTMLNANRPRQLATLPGTTAVVTAFANRRRVIATVSRGGPTTPARLILWDLTDPAQPQQTSHVDIPVDVQPRSATFADDDRILYLGGSIGEVTAWKVDTPAQPQKLSEVNGNRSQIDLLISSPDSHTLISGDTTGLLTIWDISTSKGPRDPIRLNSRGSRLNGLALAPDNGTLLGVGLTAAAKEPSLVRWQLDASRSAKTVCQIIDSPPITKAQWNEYLPGALYHPPCK